jgi:hypothetical protein
MPCNEPTKLLDGATIAVGKQFVVSRQCTALLVSYVILFVVYVFTVYMNLLYSVI